MSCKNPANGGGGFSDEDASTIKTFKEKMGVSGNFRTKSDPDDRAEAVKIFDRQKDPTVKDAMLDQLRKNSPNTVDYLKNKQSRDFISTKAAKESVAKPVVDRLHKENNLTSNPGEVPYNGGKPKRKSKSHTGGKARSRSRSRSKSRSRSRSKSKPRRKSKGKSKK